MTKVYDLIAEREKRICSSIQMSEFFAVYPEPDDVTLTGIHENTVSIMESEMNRLRRERDVARNTANNAMHEIRQLRAEVVDLEHRLAEETKRRRDAARSAMMWREAYEGETPVERLFKRIGKTVKRKKSINWIRFNGE